jgi:PhnB protein
MKRIIPDIQVESCKEALEYYKSIFGGRVENLQLADAHESFKGHEGKVIHSELHINDDCIIYLVDVINEKRGTGSHISLLLSLESEDEINRIYNSLSKDGSVEFELQKTFWGAYHAVLTDKFGTTWELNYM